jgi:transposase
MMGEEQSGKCNAEEKVRRVRLKPVNRQQMMLRAVEVEKLVPEDHEVRAIWEFVGRLDLSRYYEEIKAGEGEAGCSAFDPQVLISIWIYAYSKGVGSAREVSRLTEDNGAYQWITGLKAINYHTLSDFRVKHKAGLDELFVEALGIMSAEGLVTLERVMQDGTKVKAYAGGDSFRREGTLRGHLEAARQQVEQMGDPRTAEEMGPRVNKARQRAVRERKERLELALQELEKVREMKRGAEDKKEARVSETDPEARIMKQGNGGYAPSYNLELSTDSAARVIVGVDVTQAASDYEQLIPAMDRIKDKVGQDPKEAVSDGGFTSRENIIAMEQRGVNFIGSMGTGVAQSAGQMDRRGVDPAFRPHAFSYDPVGDTYRCPAGKTLKYVGKENQPGRTNYRYRISGAECRACEFKSKCCPQNEREGRMIVRGVDAPEVARFIAKMETEEAKQIYKQRGAIAEFPNAWIKDKIGLRQFRLRGLIKVGMEALWACLTYNIQQWIRLRWRPRWA